jgi:hypothetical protein
MLPNAYAWTYGGTWKDLIRLRARVSSYEEFMLACRTDIDASSLFDVVSNDMGGPMGAYRFLSALAVPNIGGNS